MNLDQALGEFDAAETTLRRLEDVWQRLIELVPSGISFMGSSAEGIEYEDLQRAFRALADGLPAIGTSRISEVPLDLDEIAQNRFDAQEIGEIEALVAVERGVSTPGEAIREYRFQFNWARRQLVRHRVQELIAQVQDLLSELVSKVQSNNEPVIDPKWTVLVESVREIERLMGSGMTRKGRWSELARHIAFGQGCDLHDIANHDWPSVLADIESALFGELEPIPVQVDDLAELAASQPRGPVSTKLAWEVLDDEGFERLVFNIIGDARGYENPKWLTRTHAPDRGRDLSVDRVVPDALSGVTHQRAIVQCRHWLTKSVRAPDVAEAVAAVKLCEPPPVDVLILVTSGRFTADAVTWIEKHNHDRDRPIIHAWAETHLESLLAQRPHLVSEFGLRSGA